MESPLTLLSILLPNLASSCNTEMTNHSHTIMYGDQCPIFDDIKILASILQFCGTSEGNAHDNLKEETISIPI